MQRIANQVLISFCQISLIRSKINVNGFELPFIFRITCVQLQCHALIRAHLNHKQVRLRTVVLDQVTLARRFFELNHDSC
ncbi:hypothetical protein D3C74_432020 [compost metagenome]